mgnify:FL=1
MKLVGIVPGDQAAGLLATIASRAPNPEIATAAVRELAARDTRALPFLWPILESPDPPVAATGEWILDRLRFSRAGLAALLAAYARALPPRRRWIERHLRACGDQALGALSDALRASDRDEERQTILQIRAALEQP